MTITLHQGQVIGHYQVVAELGSGAFATVYTCFDTRSPPTATAAARDPLLAAPLVLKAVSKRDLDDDALALTRLEAQIHASLPAHPNIVSLREWFEDAAALYLVLDRCDCGDLYDLVHAPPQQHVQMRPGTPGGFGTPTKHHAPRARAGLPDHVVKRYAVQLASALAACHAAGVYHRDLKLENVLLAGPLDAQGFPERALLADFGLATREVFSTELGLGTRAYLAPECLDEALDGYASAAADVFALALVVMHAAHPHVRLWRSTSVGDRDWEAFAAAVARARPPTRHAARLAADGNPAAAHAAAADPADKWLATRHPQLSPALRRVLVRALDPAPLRRATLQELARMLHSVDAFACARTPSLLVAQLKHANPTAAVEHGAQLRAASPAHSPMLAPAASAMLSAHGRDADFDLDFGAHSDSDVEDDMHDARSPGAKSPASTAPSSGFPSPAKNTGAQPHAIPVPAALKPTAAAVPGGMVGKPSPLAHKLVPVGKPAAATPPARWTAAFAHTASPAKAAGAGGVSWSELDDDDDDDLLSGFVGSPAAASHNTGLSPASKALYLQALGGKAGATAKVAPRPASPAKQVPEPATATAGGAAQATAQDARGKHGKESLDSALGVSLSQGIARMRV